MKRTSANWGWMLGVLAIAATTAWLCSIGVIARPQVTPAPMGRTNLGAFDQVADARVPRPLATLVPMGRESVMAAPADWREPFVVDGMKLGMHAREIIAATGNWQKWTKRKVGGYEVWSGTAKQELAFNARGALVGIRGFRLAQENYLITVDPFHSRVGWTNLGEPDRKSDTVWVWNHHRQAPVVRIHVSDGRIDLVRNENVPL